MRLFDTARQAVVPFESRGDQVAIYVCGITPYDSAHLGHAFVYHVFDVLARRLQARGLRVQSVRNVTDVDDDILRVARERGVDFRALGDEQVRRFDRDMEDIGLLPVTSAPRATAHVPEMAGWVARLQDFGYAYEREGWVYFETGLFPEYGRLSRLDEAAMVKLSRERGGNPEDPRKRHPLDFVLWQPSQPGEPSWPSPWGAGRPGWHIECSVLSTGELGHPIDIHGGGDDLIYPHHESEIAQAEAAGVAPYVRHWVHAAMVNHQGVKMSKSLGNLIFVRDLLQRTSGATIRLMLAAHHYRTSWSFADDDLAEAETRRTRYAEAMESGGSLDEAEAAELRRQFFEQLDDDIDTPGALRIVDLAAVALTHSGRRGGASGLVSADQLMTELLDVLGARAVSPVR
jgi:L-cysteine:1D-myo-inositol 2-amino-2-deoxy-alpha-D-glucopyranoside ligase